MSSRSKSRFFLTTLATLFAPLGSVLIFILVWNQLDASTESDADTIQYARFGEHGRFLKEAERLQLYSLESMSYQIEEGEDAPELFHDYRVLGSVTVQDHQVIASIWRDLKKRINRERGKSYTMCFEPRHGIRAYCGEDFKDYLICFNCHHLYLYESEGGEPRRVGLEGERVNSFLNRILDEREIKREESTNY